MKNALKDRSQKLFADYKGLNRISRFEDTRIDSVNNPNAGALEDDGVPATTQAKENAELRALERYKAEQLRKQRKRKFEFNDDEDTEQLTVLGGKRLDEHLSVLD